MLVGREDWLYEMLVCDCEPVGMIVNPQAVGFWEKIWPAFIAELNDDSDQLPTGLEVLNG